MKTRWWLILLIIIGILMLSYPLISLGDDSPQKVTLSPLQDKTAVEQFMLSDTTDQHPYTDTYKCGSYARDVVYNASLQGIEAYVMSIGFFETNTLHAIVLFPTNEGDVYVDATQGDWWVEFELGQGNYSSYTMAVPTRYGISNRTISIYGIIESDGTLRWTSPPKT